MSTRLSFFEVPQISQGDLENLRRGIHKEQLTSRKHRGFVVDRSSTSQISGKFVIKTVSKDEYEDPFGRLYIQRSINYSQQSFILRDAYPHLILINPSPLANALTGRFLVFTNFKFSLNEIIWQPVEVFQFIKNTSSSARIYSIRIDGIPLTNDIVAKIHIEGNSSDLRECIKPLIKNRSFKYSSVKAEFEIANKLRKCEIKNLGSVTVFGDPDPAIMEYWIKLVEKLHQKQNGNQRLS